MMVLVRDFDHFANWCLHSRNWFHFAIIGECFRGRIIGALRHHDAGAHVIGPGGDELLFHVVVSFNGRALEGKVFHLAIAAGHFH